MKQKKLKTTLMDLILFAAYHFAVVFGTFCILVVLTKEMPFAQNAFMKRFYSSVLSKAAGITSASLFKVKGEVFITTGKERKPAEEGASLKAGDVVETGANSFAILSFGEKYVCKVRVNASSMINIEELLKNAPQTQEESTSFAVMAGNILVNMDNKTEKVQVKFRAKYATFAVRGTKFLIGEDENRSSILSVQEGIVDVVNNLTAKASAVVAGSIFMADPQGKEIVSQDPELMKQVDWNIESENTTSVNLSQIQSTMVDVARAADMKAAGIDDVFLELVASELKKFREASLDIPNQIDELKLTLGGLEKQIAEETPKLKQDIKCLETQKTVKCKLYSEKILMGRGFAQMYGTASYKLSLIEGIKAYQREEENKVKDANIEIDRLNQLQVQRSDVAHEVDDLLLRMKSGEVIENPKRAIDKLNDSNLQP